jgi:hypothetical protein
MKYIILGVLWASVCCIVIPINGQAARKDTNTGKAKPADSQPPKIDVVNVDTVNVTKLNVAQQPDPTRKGDNDNKESKSYLRRLVAAENLPNLILCGIGIAGVIAAICSLNVIRQQAHWMKKQTRILIQYNKATREAADAAVLNANTLLESQRPKITAVGLNTFETVFNSDIPRIEIELSNKGMTTAYDCIYETWTEILPAPFDDFTSSAQYFKSEAAFALHPTQETAINIPLKGKLTQAATADLSTGNKLLCVRICVRYRDFKEGRFSNFGYFLKYGGFGFLPKYNDCN